MTVPTNLRVEDRFAMGTWGGEPIGWRVLNVSNNTALVISEKVSAASRSTPHRVKATTGIQATCVPGLSELSSPEPSPMMRALG